MRALSIAFDGVSIDGHIGHDVPDAMVEAICALDPDRILVISDDTVLDRCASWLPLLAAERPVHVISGPGGERLKSLPHLSRCLEDALAWGMTRRSLVVGFGGGVVGNLAGLVAALLFRGLRLVQVPTTLLAMHDSVISLKQAVNSASGKNLIGTFHVPQAILIDTAFLDTLEPREWRSGLVEVIKNALALRPSMLPRLRGVLRADLDFAAPDRLWLIEESIAAKLAIMRRDRHESKAAIVLEYGHTVGHAIEYASLQRSAGAAISHGEAVGLGMVAAAHVAAELTGLPQEDVGRHSLLLQAIGAPTNIPPEVSRTALVSLIARDNKRGYLALDDRDVAMILLKKIGAPAGSCEVPLVPVRLSLIEECLGHLKSC